MRAIPSYGDFERFYGCTVEFGRAASEGASSDLLKFSNDALAIPLITADAKLLEALQPFCDMAARERKTAAGTLRPAVESEVERLLPHGKAQAQTVPKALALSIRTLSRRLADEGTTYAEVVDQLRRSLALQYLNDAGISLRHLNQPRDVPRGWAVSSAHGAVSRCERQTESGPSSA
jgi:hypothetical protein